MIQKDLATASKTAPMDRDWTMKPLKILVTDFKNHEKVRRGVVMLCIQKLIIEVDFFIIRNICERITRGRSA